MTADKLIGSDVKAIKVDPHMTDGFDCDYFEYSTVPDQTGGPFWSILNRIFISKRLSYNRLIGVVFECMLLTLSEVGVPKRFFEQFLPILGPAHGLGSLGAFQAL